MDNITHSLAGALIGQMGLKRQSRFAMAACLLGANAPDIDVFAPLVLPVQGIAFHRGPVHGIFAWPLLAAGVVAILWLVDRLRPGTSHTPRFRTGPLYVVALLAVLTHPFLDWLTTYAIAVFAPVSWRWYSADAIFIVDWVYWLLMIAGIVGTWLWQRKGRPFAGRPARIAGIVMLCYISANVVESAWAERATRLALRRDGIASTLVVASPPPFAFWRRTMAWRSKSNWGGGAFDPVNGLSLDRSAHRLGLNSNALTAGVRGDSKIRAFMSWSRMPIVVNLDRHQFLTDQRFYGPLHSDAVPRPLRSFFAKHAFLIPLGTP